jgi:hypothetical protein
MTFRDALHLLLNKLDLAWKDVLACHADMEHCNEASKQYKEAKERLAAVERQLWRLKAAWADQDH